MILLAEFEQGYHLVGTLTEYVLPYHASGNIVMRRSNFTQPTGANRDLPATTYRVLAIAQFTFEDSGITYFQGKLDNSPATCNEYPYSPEQDQLNDVTTPFFYILQNMRNGKILGADPANKIHESDCLPDAVVQDYIKNNIDFWWVIP